MNWIKKHKVLITVAAALVLFLGIPLGIHILFKVRAGIDFFAAEWSPGDALDFYGSVLSFIGTVALGALALYQNKLVKDESDKRSALLEQREHEKNMPKFTVESQGWSGSFAHFHFTLYNISENIANEIEIYDTRILKPDGTLLWSEDRTIRIAAIQKHAKEDVRLTNTGASENCVLMMSMRCRDKYNELHEYIIKGVLDRAEENKPKLRITEI